MNICIIGSGYVGLVTGACLTHLGANVVCYDKDYEKIVRLQQGKLPIYEPGLEELIQQPKITFSADLEASVKEAQAVFIAVGTPSQSDGSVDLSAIFEVARELSAFIRPHTAIVIKSTVPPGTCRAVKARIQEVNPTLAFEVISNPEFLREGSAIADFMHPDRIVLGCDNPEATSSLQRLYKCLGAPILVPGLETAELIKYATNGFLAMKIAFINEIADLCEQVGGNVEEVAAGLGADQRVGKAFLNPGPGFGGSCFPKDLRGIIALGQKSGAPLTILEAVRMANEERKRALVNKIEHCLEDKSLQNKTLAFLGLTFKANTDDLREAVSLTLIPLLQAKGAQVVAYDPMVSTPPLPGVQLAKSPYEAARGADALIVLTEWEEFKTLDLQSLKTLLRQPLFIDLRNVMCPRVVAQNGFNYHSLGRPPLLGASK